MESFGIQSYKKAQLTPNLWIRPACYRACFSDSWFLSQVFFHCNCYLEINRQFPKLVYDLPAKHDLLRLPTF